MAVRRIPPTWPWPPDNEHTISLTEHDLQTAIDTALITEAYMGRPVQQIAIGLGAWFNTAMGVKDDLLAHLEGQAAKKHIINAGYNTMPEVLNRLNHFNKVNQE